jgi:shikimate dehydrogenase
MPRLGVLGWPVAHSRSPAMHNAALAEMGLNDWHYQRLPVPPELFEETVRGLPGAPATRPAGSAPRTR